MPESMPSLADEDPLLGSELEKLFALQDKPLSKDKKGILVHELRGTGMPFKALLSGIRSMLNEDLHVIKFSMICAAARKFVESDSEVGRSCEHCSQGMVIMRDDAGALIGLACKCPIGNERARSQFLSRWDGGNTQHSKGRLLHRVCRA